MSAFTIETLEAQLATLRSDLDAEAKAHRAAIGAAILDGLDVPPSTKVDALQRQVDAVEAALDLARQRVADAEAAALEEARKVALERVAELKAAAALRCNEAFDAAERFRDAVLPLASIRSELVAALVDAGLDTGTRAYQSEALGYMLSMCKGDLADTMVEEAKRAASNRHETPPPRPET